MSTRTLITRRPRHHGRRGDPRRRTIEGGRIAALAPRLGRPAWTADRTIDATGKYVIPGGVDAHTHMEMPFGGTFASDTFETGTRAAAWGGTTTIVDFAVQSRSAARCTEGLDAWMRRRTASAPSTTAST